MSFSVETKTSSYKLPLILAIMVHAILIWFIFTNVELAVPTPVAQKRQKPVDIVKAVAVNQAQVEDEIAKIKAGQQQKQQRQAAQQRKLQKLAQQAAQARAKEQARLKQLKAEQAKLQKLQAQKQRAAEKRLADLKKRQAAQQQSLAKLEKQQAVAATENAKQEALAKQQAAQAQQKKIAQQEAAKQAAEDKAATQARAQELQGVVNKYAVMIKQSIEQRWIIPDNINKDMSTKLQVRLAPGGTVVDVRVITSSGDTRLDRSARAAVFKASPLPVPSEPQMFDRFRVLNLTLRPEGVLTSST